MALLICKSGGARQEINVLHPRAGHGFRISDKAVRQAPVRVLRFGVPVICLIGRCAFLCRPGPAGKYSCADIAVSTIIETLISIFNRFDPFSVVWRISKPGVVPLRKINVFGGAARSFDIIRLHGRQGSKSPAGSPGTLCLCDGNIRRFCNPIPIQVGSPKIQFFRQCASRRDPVLACGIVAVACTGGIAAVAANGRLIRLRPCCAHTAH